MDKMENRQVKHSLTLQYTGTILGMVAGTVLLCWFLNNTFLEDYGFRVIEDITYVSSIERINLEEEGGTKWNG